MNGNASTNYYSNCTKKKANSGTLTPFFNEVLIRNEGRYLPKRWSFRQHIHLERRNDSPHQRLHLHRPGLDGLQDFSVSGDRCPLVTLHDNFVGNERETQRLHVAVVRSHNLGHGAVVISKPRM
jgi:hypothetical protein